MITKTSIPKHCFSEWVSMSLFNPLRLRNNMNIILSYGKVIIQYRSIISWIFKDNSNVNNKFSLEWHADYIFSQQKWIGFNSVGTSLKLEAFLFYVILSTIIYCEYMNCLNDTCLKGCFYIFVYYYLLLVSMKTHI